MKNQKDSQKNLNRIFVLALSFSLVSLINWLDYGYYEHYFSLLIAGFVVVVLCIGRFGVFKGVQDDKILVVYAIIQIMVMCCYLVMLTAFSDYADKILYTGLLSLANMMLLYELFMLTMIGGCFVLAFLGWLSVYLSGDSVNLPISKRVNQK